MNIDSIVYRNMVHLIEQNGITERMCIIACELNPNFFVNYRRGRTKHFRICDLISVAAFFGVTIDYLCRFENIEEEPFCRKYKANPEDEKILMRAIRKLDPVGRIHLSDFVNAELEQKKLREKERKADARRAAEKTARKA